MSKFTNSLESQELENEMLIAYFKLLNAGNKYLEHLQICGSPEVKVVERLVNDLEEIKYAYYTQLEKLDWQLENLNEH